MRGSKGPDACFWGQTPMVLAFNTARCCFTAMSRSNTCCVEPSSCFVALWYVVLRLLCCDVFRSVVVWRAMLLFVVLRCAALRRVVSCCVTLRLGALSGLSLASEGLPLSFHLWQCLRNASVCVCVWCGSFGPCMSQVSGALCFMVRLTCVYILSHC